VVILPCANLVQISAKFCYESHANSSQRHFRCFLITVGALFCACKNSHLVATGGCAQTLYSMSVLQIVKLDMRETCCRTKKATPDPMCSGSRTTSDKAAILYHCSIICWIFSYTHYSNLVFRASRRHYLHYIVAPPNLSVRSSTQLSPLYLTRFYLGLHAYVLDNHRPNRIPPQRRVRSKGSARSVQPPSSND
jgi:hypothetical protein